MATGPPPRSATSPYPDPYQYPSPYPYRFPYPYPYPCPFTPTPNQVGDITVEEKEEITKAGIGALDQA
jgi:hypothetical protein